MNHRAKYLGQKSFGYRDASRCIDTHLGFSVLCQPRMGSGAVMCRDSCVDFGAV